MKSIIKIIAKEKFLGIIATLILLVLHAGEAEEESDWDKNGQPIVHTFKGTLKGLEEESVNGGTFFSFYSIPYAKPPLGELRFQDPVEEEAWTTVRDASSQPEPCSQVTFKEEKMEAVSEDDVIGSEDCLYLNVFTPKVTRNEKLPVMVYLHGGSWVGGAASKFEPYVLLDHQVVLVVPQFRLGTLGFLSTEDEVVPGNYMLKDQLAVLKWVQRNIGAFGGDPNTVLMFGESAGGMSSSYLSISPKAQGLFSRTAWHSGSALSTHGIKNGHRKVAEEIAISMGLSGKLDSKSILSFLQTVPAKNLTFAAYKFFKYATTPNVMAPRVDGDVIPQDPFKMLQTMSCPPWEVISGTTAHDGALFTHHFYLRESLRTPLEKNFTEYGALLLDLSDDDANASMKATSLFQYYLGENIDFDLSDNFTQLITDYLYGVASDLMVLWHAACPEPRNKTFSFKFKHRGEVSSSDKLNVTVGKEWVAHMDDLIYMFPADALLGGSKPLSSPEDLAVRDIMTKLWVNFAATGNPTPDASLGFTWEPVQFNNLRNLNLMRTPSMAADLRGQVREFYRTLLPEHDELLKELEMQSTLSSCVINSLPNVCALQMRREQSERSSVENKLEDLAGNNS